MCWMCTLPICTKLSRCRQIERTAQMVCEGRWEARRRPTECRYWSHWQSATSVLQPGTFFTHGGRSPNILESYDLPKSETVESRKRQWTPWQRSRNQSASRYRSSVKLKKRRTGYGSRSGGTAAYTSVEPMSIPAASGSRIRIRDKAADLR